MHSVYGFESCKSNLFLHLMYTDYASTIKKYISISLSFSSVTTMARRFTRVESDVSLSETRGEDERECQDINWNLCALCQTDTKEHLICSARGDGAGYVYVAERLEEFRTLGSCPIPVDLSKLDEGRGFSATLQQHTALWHKQCRTSINKLKVKRKQQAHSQSNSPVKIRKTHEVSDNKELKCIFCNKPDDGKQKLHRTWTVGLDFKVRKCAEHLRDQELLGKLSSGDMVATDAMYHFSCLIKLYRRAEKSKPTEDSDNFEKLHALCFAQLVSYIESLRDYPGKVPVMDMPSLCQYDSMFI